MNSDRLKNEIRSLIENENYRKFYVGKNGDFDSEVLKRLRELKEEFPFIEYTVVLAYLNGKASAYSFAKPHETLFPDGLENVPKRFAIVWRNNWILKQSDTVICYVIHHFGGAGQMIQKAKKQGKRVINITNTDF